ncbi:hypothetical protein KIW84_012661 [Lathyrus oleraceus]|uniref:Uncharacterized protein n=1 Tax=Pisum sativum TaxID=3888 RepID=A0A9D5BIF4_PEA|nr:hypothetical protein KIW84_012661 [Pisum sativum]
MASQLSYKGKGKGKASSSRGSLDLSRLFTTRQQQERYETFFFQKKIMKPKYRNFVTFPEEVFTFPSVFEELGLCNLIGFHLDFYPELVKIPPSGHKFLGTLAPWENYSKHDFYYSLSRLSEHQIYNKRKKSSGGDNLE